MAKIEILESAQRELEAIAEYITDSWEDTTDNHDDGTHGNSKAVHHSRHRCQTYVLAERSDRSTTEKTGNRTYETIAADCRTHLLSLRITLQCTVAERRSITNRLCGRNQIYCYHRENSTDIKLRCKWKKLWQSYDRETRKSTEIYHSHKQSQNITYQQSYQYRE